MRNTCVRFGFHIVRSYKLSEPAATTERHCRVLARSTSRPSSGDLIAFAKRSTAEWLPWLKSEGHTTRDPKLHETETLLHFWRAHHPPVNAAKEAGGRGSASMSASNMTARQRRLAQIQCRYAARCHDPNCEYGHPAGRDRKHATDVGGIHVRKTQQGRRVASQERLQRAQQENDREATDSEGDPWVWRATFANDEPGKVKFVERYLIDCLQELHAKTMPGSKLLSGLLRDRPTVDKDVLLAGCPSRPNGKYNSFKAFVAKHCDTFTLDETETGNGGYWCVGVAGAQSVDSDGGGEATDEADPDL